MYVVVRDAYPDQMHPVTPLYVLYNFAILDELKLRDFLNPLLRNRIRPATLADDVFPP